ncbi:MAG: hypothetical protein ICV85_01260 [Tolypothrix sp. T3-bin4]|nr:hypothetical protein [Tolypothrix sp. T3-bin4]
MDFNLLMQMLVIGETIAYAIEDGRQWGQSFANNFYWAGNKDNIANLMILESTVWSVGNGILNGVLGFAGIPTEIAITLYSQVKLASALFTIYGIDIRSPSSRPLVLAAAAGMTVAELANELGTLLFSSLLNSSENFINSGIS